MTRRLPPVRGMGRVVLLADTWLTDANDEQSYMIASDVNDACRLLLDLRGWEQKFAFYYGRWEQALMQSVKRHFHQGVFYDVGASIGLYAMAFGSICRTRGTYVRAFEPVPLNLARLRQQFPLNGLDETTVRIEPTAVGESTSIVRLILVDAGRPGNAKIATYGGIAADMTTLDAVWEQNDHEHVGFIKIDTEGWDAKILAGASSLIRTCRPNLLVEFNRERMRNLHDTLDNAWQFLVEELRYACVRIDHRGREVSLSAPESWENLLFIAGNKEVAS